MKALSSCHNTPNCEIKNAVEVFFLSSLLLMVVCITSASSGTSLGKHFWITLPSNSLSLNPRLPIVTTVLSEISLPRKQTPCFLPIPNDPDLLHQSGHADGDRDTELPDVGGTV